MPNLTVSMDRETLRAAKVYAASHGVSLSRIIREHLRELTGRGPRRPPGDDALERFSQGLMGRREVMAELGVDYGTLIRMLGERGLRLPVLPPDEIERMAALVDEVLSPGPT